MTPPTTYRRFTPPLGWPFTFRMVTVTPADRHPLLTLNRYPRQVIGVGIRLPDAGAPHKRDRNTGRPYGHHRALSITWSKPARWWR